LLVPYGDSGAIGASSGVGSVFASPYRPPPVEASTKRRAPAALAASRTVAVPATLIITSWAGSSTDRRTPIWAARWTTTSGCSASISACIAAPSTTSAWCSSTPARRFSRRPVERSSTTATSCPSSSSASTTCEPMKPAPPVTRIRMSGSA
jgi:hypothetical protein